MGSWRTRMCFSWSGMKEKQHFGSSGAATLHPAHFDARKFIDGYATDTISVDFDPAILAGPPVEANAAEVASRPDTIPDTDRGDK
jgi:hypothetical protein